MIGLPTTDADPSVRRAQALRLLLGYVAEGRPAPAPDPRPRERR